MKRLAARSVLVAAIAALTAGIAPGPAGAIVPQPIMPNLTPPPAPLPAEEKHRCFSGGVEPVGDSPSVPYPQAMLDFASVWPFTTGAGQKVAVIDTGVSPHPRLRMLAGGGDLVGGGDGLQDCQGHGTLVAGLIGAAPARGSGFAGGAPDAEILSIRQTSDYHRPQGRSEGDHAETSASDEGGYGYLTDLARAIRTAADAGATVINISVVTCSRGGIGPDDAYIGSALDYAVNVRDVVVVAAAGNVGSGCEAQNPIDLPTDPTVSPWDSVSLASTPGWHDDLVLTVGSIDQNGRPSDFSLAGPWVDVAAPGSRVTSLSQKSDRMAVADGTSFAAPLVSATAALVRSYRPELNARQVMERITRTAHSGAEDRGLKIGYGVVDPLAAVTSELPFEGASVEEPDSVAVAAPQAPPVADPRPRTVALTAAGILVVLFGLGIAASFPLGRRLRARPASRRGR
ncbi:type VII secretion-associated serine protease mycosin [Rhodococcus rhodnii]|uniref:Esx cluster secreted serine peptidase n=1 Tax=Rhodococcus rhodnii LMG 5362 TaxID=1273125 RepID=R7WHU1_9NOCA|nr:type VII secretion-associated serine protease mycosin [Rhodococcus rhodnii]EOM74652.1 esx cluster secreted serine peptidase [Rhodococcus rhodnii LMG 5362]